MLGFKTGTSRMIAGKLLPFTLTLALTLYLATGASANATGYYVDSILGNDAFDGKSSATPWRTLGKVNALLGSAAKPPAAIVAGDTVYLRTGRVWDETLVIRRSGTSTAPIKFAGYGDAGATPPTLRASTAILGPWARSNSDPPLYQIKVPGDIGQLTFSSAENAAGEPMVLPFARYPNVAATLASGPDMLRVHAPVACPNTDGVASVAGDDGPSACGLAHVENQTLNTHDLTNADLVIRAGAYR
jgi:hypothetical protein